MKEHSGYSLIELMVAMAVLAVAMTYGVPMLNIYFQGNRMITNTNELVASIHVARSEAIKRGERVSVCKSANAEVASPLCTLTGDWEQGWFVFVDSDAVKGTYNSSADGAVLRRQPGVAGSNVTIVPQDTSISNFVSFTTRGIPKTGPGASQSGVFSVCDSRGLKNAASGVVTARGVVLNASGRVRTTNDAAKIVVCP